MLGVFSDIISYANASWQSALISVWRIACGVSSVTEWIRICMVEPALAHWIGPQGIGALADAAEQIQALGVEIEQLHR